MSVVTVKKQIINKDNEIMLKRKFRRFLGLGTVWKHWRLLNNIQYKIEWDIIKSLEKIEDLLEARRKAIATLEAEKKEIYKSSNGGRYEESDPYRMKVSSKDYWVKRFPDMKKPPEDWKNKLSESFLGQANKEATVTGKMARERMNRRREGKSVITTSEAAASSFALDVGMQGIDEVYAHKERNNQSQKGKDKRYRKRRTDETAEEHQERLKRIDSGKHEPGDFDVIIHGDI